MRHGPQIQKRAYKVKYASLVNDHAMRTGT